MDVFFVISGYLITGHLVDEQQRTGRIDLTRFWARRIRRLLPAAFTVLAVSALLMLVFMPRLTWQTNLQEIGASCLYIENWLLGIHAVDYLAAHNSPTVAQHMWSLSVEEQFYVCWPLGLLLVGALGKALRPTRRRLVMLLTLGLVAGVSLAASVHWTAVQTPLAFFSTPTRVWEFAAGGLLVFLPRATTVRARMAPALTAVGWVGVALVVGSTVAITGQQPFPGWIALLPVAGAVLVLGSEALGRWSLESVAGWAPIGWVGDRSYAIYLWHWPLIIAAPWAVGTATMWSKIAILAASLVLAGLTKRFIEDPARTSRRWVSRRWPAYAFAAGGMAVILALSAVVYATVQHSNATAAAAASAQLDANAPCFGAGALVERSRCSAPFTRPAQLDLAFARSDVTEPSLKCQPDTGAIGLVLCTFGQTEAPSKVIVVVGNSHAMRLIPALQQYGKDRGWEIVLAAKTDCLGLISTPLDGGRPDACQTWSGELLRHLQSMPKLDGVIFVSHGGAQQYLAGAGATPSDLRLARERMVTAWTALRQRGAAVMVAQDVPGMRPDSDPECLARSGATDDPCAVPRASVLVPNFLTDVAQQNPQLVDYLKLDPYLCDADRCHALVGGVVVYADSNHLTTTFSRSLGRYLGADVAKVLAASP